MFSLTTGGEIQHSYGLQSPQSNPLEHLDAQQLLELQIQLEHQQLQLQHQQQLAELLESQYAEYTEGNLKSSGNSAIRSRSFSRDQPRQQIASFSSQYQALQNLQSLQHHNTGLTQAQILQSQLSHSTSPHSQTRRSRAETFSSFPSKFIDEQFTNPLGSDANRHRSGSGSLTLPSSSLVNAFPQSLFATSWEAAATALNGGTDTNLTTNSNSELPDEASLARNLDYLGIDDPETNSNTSNNNSNTNSNSFGSPGLHQHKGIYSSPLSFRPRSNSNNLMSPNSTSTAPLAATINELATRLNVPSNAASVAAALRARSYSVAVGENLVQNLSVQIPNNLRPRATSIAYLESERELPNPVGTPARERSGSTGSNQPTTPHGHYERSKLGRVSEPDTSADEVESVIDNEGEEPALDTHYNLEFPMSGNPTTPYFPPLSQITSPYGADAGLPHNLTYLSPQSPTRSLWIGNIDPTLSAADLLTVFTPFGTIESVRILPDKECAFVNYCRVEDAVSAKESLQGGRIGNCVVKIGFGRPDTGESTSMQPSKSLWIGNIPPSTNPSELEQIFSQFGEIESARVLTHKNCGFVNFVNLDEAIEARKAMNGQEIAGSIVKIGFAKVPDGVTMMGNGFNYGGEGNIQSALGIDIGSEGMKIGLKSPMVNGETFSANPYLSPQRFNDLSATPISPMPISHKDDLEELEVPEDRYFTTVSVLPEPNPNRKVDQNRARELRKRLESHISAKEVESIFLECIDDAVDLSSDYIGNVVIQKLMEKCNDQQRQRLIDKIAPHLSSIGIHKNGTWAAQKIIDCARTPGQIHSITTALQPYTPPLLLDQFGNYVIQCCLRLGTQRNQFIFDALHTKCWEIAQGRFGARAMRACLESSYTTKRQQKHVSIAIVQNAVSLCMNANGSILITWLLDTSGLPGRYRVLAPKLAPHVAMLCTHKLANAAILKIVNQQFEPDARDVILKEIFFTDDTVLTEILSDTFCGVTLLQKILASSNSAEERIALADRIRVILNAMPEGTENQLGYKRLTDELSMIPSLLGIQQQQQQQQQARTAFGGGVFVSQPVNTMFTGYYGNGGGMQQDVYGSAGTPTYGYETIQYQRPKFVEANGRKDGGKKE
ncbi:hypothetical protein HK098_003974 [Nowakowskiella sp. JEL0407]|nr:hypothetical protein HK098_003974 [Nowakowskiella sp. JEL0407]